jgi:hypothetical protein
MDTTEIEKQLLLYKKKEKKTTIELEKLEQIIDKEYAKVFIIIEDLVNNNFLEPKKSSGLNYKNKQLYNKYSIIHKESDELAEKEKAELLKELNYTIYFKINIDAYKQNLKLYIKHQPYVELFSSFMKKNSNLLNIPCSINERSFEVFKDEKFLKENPLSKELFKAMGLDIDILNYYLAPEPFFFYKVSEEVPQNIIIVENKDTFYTIRKLLMEGRSVLGMNFSTVIYGEGKKIISSMEDIYYNDNVKYLDNKNNVFYYWGDIDKEGLQIYQKFKTSYDGLNIMLLKEAYHMMLELSKIYGIHKCKNPQRVKIEDLTELDSEASNAILAIALEDNYIPQEIISYRRLIKK